MCSSGKVQRLASQTTKIEENLVEFDESLEDSERSAG